MPTDAALLPPDPSVPGRYWLKTHDGLDVIGRWSEHGRWRAEDWGRPVTAADIAFCGYTLASPHPIPGPAALEAIYAAMDALAQKPGWSAAGSYELGRRSAITEARAMLRAALETKEAP